MKGSWKRADWVLEGTRRFGPDKTKWRFVCPVCGHVATPEEWRAAGASEGEIAFSCIGRRIAGSAEAFRDTKQGPCNYAGGGLFRLNPVHVEELNAEFFAFAEVDKEGQAA